VHALACLAERGDKEAVDAIRTSCGDIDLAVRDAAESALSGLTKRRRLEAAVC